MTLSKMHLTSALVLVLALWLPFQVTHAWHMALHPVSACGMQSDTGSIPGDPACGGQDVLFNLSTCEFVCSGTVAILPELPDLELFRAEQLATFSKVSRLRWALGPEPFPPKIIT